MSGWASLDGYSEVEVKIEHIKEGPESRESHRLGIRRKRGGLGG